jgi:hypothetical protein
MPEIKVQDPVCGKCGVDIRPDTEFCYNCGSSVTSPAAPAVRNGAEQTDEENLRTETEFSAHVSDAGAGTANGNSARLQDRRPDPPKYESAAGLRKRSKPATRKPVEITWEPKTDSPNLTFIIATICLVVLAIILIAAAQYLK